LKVLWVMFADHRVSVFALIFTLATNIQISILRRKRENQPTF
jgi:hypothetical protein